MGHAKRKYASNMRKCADSDHRAHAQSLTRTLHSPVSNESISGKRRAQLDCADAQGYLGLRCLHRPEDVFPYMICTNKMFQTNQIQTHRLFQT